MTGTGSSFVMLKQSPTIRGTRLLPLGAHGVCLASTGLAVGKPQELLSLAEEDCRFPLHDCVGCHKNGSNLFVTNTQDHLKGLNMPDCDNMA